MQSPHLLAESRPGGGDMDGFQLPESIYTCVRSSDVDVSAVPLAVQSADKREFPLEVSADVLATMLREARVTKLPDSNIVFPWLHGDLGPGVHLWSPRPAWPVERAGLLLVKVGSLNDEFDTLKGSVDAKDFFGSTVLGNPTMPFRNFAAQSQRWGQICDLVVYASDPKLVPKAFDIAKILAEMQIMANSKRSTLVLREPISALVDALGGAEGFLVDNTAPEFYDYDPITPLQIPVQKSRVEEWDMGMAELEDLELLNFTRATQVEPRLWIGNDMDMQWYTYISENPQKCSTGIHHAFANRRWATFLECICDDLELPSLRELDASIRIASKSEKITPLSMKLPGYGAIGDPWVTPQQAAALVNVCKLMWVRCNAPNVDPSIQSGVLVYCEDGYRSSSLLSILLCMFFGGGRTAADAVLHIRATRPIVMTTTDIQIALQLEPIIRTVALDPGQHLGAIPLKVFENCVPVSPLGNGWLKGFSGMFPSEILPQSLYLGPLSDANRLELLAILGIRRILSVGELVSWAPQDVKGYSRFFNNGIEVMYVDNFEDNGQDGLYDILDPCIKFLDEQPATPTLVHCFRGISRSAAICIAAVMRRFNCSLPQAYLFVRVRRLNYVINPNLRLMYDLLRFEEKERSERTVEWPVLCREIAALNLDVV